MFFRFIESVIKYGILEIVDYDGKSRIFGSKNLNQKTSEPSCTIRFHSKKLKRKIFINPELFFAEAIVDKEITIEKGSLEDLINIVTKNSNNLTKNLFHSTINFFSSKFSILQQLNFLSKSRINVQHHYDINEEVYRLFLDSDMQYSCGYFHNDNISLDQAQIDKKKYLIKKLNINKKNLKILDIGSGWGGMAIQIAKDTGANVKGITLSKNQLKTSNERIKELNLNNLVKFELEDYRKINSKFDRIISVGMFEHVGTAQYRKFFRCMKNLLTEDGSMILHSIGHVGSPCYTNPWIRKYIFPGGYIPCLSEVTKAIEKEGLWITDVEIWRLHYANTLKHWRMNFNKNREKISRILDKKFCRMWELYLLLSEYSFRNTGNMVFQIQITKNQHSLPFTRNYIYN